LGGIWPSARRPLRTKPSPLCDFLAPSPHLTTTQSPRPHQLDVQPDQRRHSWRGRFAFRLVIRSCSFLLPASGRGADLAYILVRDLSRTVVAEFKWTDVQADKDREHYLGHSVLAPAGSSLTHPSTALPSHTSDSLAEPCPRLSSLPSRSMAKGTLLTPWSTVSREAVADRPSPRLLLDTEQGYPLVRSRRR
jgi:hypothetical protein